MFHFIQLFLVCAVYLFCLMAWAGSDKSKRKMHVAASWKSLEIKLGIIQFQCGLCSNAIFVAIVLTCAAGCFQPSGSDSCKLFFFLKQKKNTKQNPHIQHYGPIWMTEHCSMCGKMAAVQRLESFIFW